MFWSMQSIKQTEWRYNNLHSCIQHVLDTLQQFLDHINIPHYFFGQGKNLLEGDIPKGKHASSEIGKFELKESRRILTERCQSLKKVVGLLKTQDTFLQLIRYALLDGLLLDYQWNWKSSLCARKLFISFGELFISSVNHQNSKKLDECLLDHFKNIISQIKSAPRKYGSLVNVNLLEFLENEIEIRRDGEGSITKLDDTEMATLLKNNKMTKYSNREWKILSSQLMDRLKEIRQVDPFFKLLNSKNNYHRSEQFEEECFQMTIPYHKVWSSEEERPSDRKTIGPTRFVSSPSENNMDSRKNEEFDINTNITLEFVDEKGNKLDVESPLDKRQCDTRIDVANSSLNSWEQNLKGAFSKKSESAPKKNRHAEKPPPVFLSIEENLRGAFLKKK